MKARLVYENDSIKTLEVNIANENGVIIASLSKEEIGEGVKHVDFMYDFFNAKVGDEGYFITDAEVNGTMMTKFTKRDNCEKVQIFSFVSCYGWNKGKDGILGIVTGMRYDMTMVLGVKDGLYYTYPRILTDGDMPYEDIKIEYHTLEDATYSKMACFYRDYQINRCGCIPLKERVKDDARLKKGAESIAVRIRHGWKPVPSPIEYQTPENEPEMHVACDFDRTGDIADKFKEFGIENAEFCLVGWNYGGHDGRFPQIFPVDPRLGGEERMIALINKMKEHGYNIVCHDDATAAYTIADCFDEEYLLKNKDGSLYKRPYCWGGGRPHKICPQRQYEKFEISNQKLLKEFGFEGIHYIDVITILTLLKCYDKNHPATRKDAADYYRKIMKLSKENFGGFSSESGFDFAASDLDYIMYASFKGRFDEKDYMCDQIVPFWHIAYHGIILYNPGTFTLNYPAKKERNRLQLFELGGRPLICYYANFAVGHNWMGLEDFICDTDEQLENSVKWAKQMADDYDQLKEERYEFIVNHEELSENVFCTTYSNGTKVIVDYNNETYKIER